MLGEQKRNDYGKTMRTYWKKIELRPQLCFTRDCEEEKRDRSKNHRLHKPQVFAQFEDQAALDS